MVKYKITHHHNFSSGSYLIDSPSIGKPAIWARNSFSNVWGTNMGTLAIVPETNQIIESYNLDSTTIIGYRYKLLEYYDPNPMGYSDSFLTKPYTSKLNPNGQIKFGCSIYVYDTSLASLPSSISLNNADLINVKLVPNPGSLYTELKFSTQRKSKFNISIFNIEGKCLQQTIGFSQLGENDIFINISNLSPSLYFVQLKIDGYFASISKLLKQ